MILQLDTAWCHALSSKSEDMIDFSSKPDNLASRVFVVVCEDVCVQWEGKKTSCHIGSLKGIAWVPEIFAKMSSPGPWEDHASAQALLNILYLRIR